MLSKIRVYNELDEYVDIHVGRPPSGVGFYVRSIDGVGPTKAEISHGEYSLVPGGSFRSSTVGLRNMTIDVGFNPSYASNQTPEDMRKILYKIANPEELVRVRFYHDDSYTYWIDGYVETHEPLIFSKDMGSTIGILCMNPYFKGSLLNEVDSTSGVTFNVDHLGDVEHGFDITVTMTPTSNMSSFSISNQLTGDKITLNRAGTGHGEIFRINTILGSKQFDRVNSSGTVQENLIGYVTTVGGWPSLRKGVNPLRVDLSVGGTGATVAMSYRNYYGGI